MNRSWSRRCLPMWRTSAGLYGPSSCSHFSSWRRVCGLLRMNSWILPNRLGLRGLATGKRRTGMPLTVSVPGSSWLAQVT